MNWRYETTSRNHWNCPSGTCFWENIMQSSKLLNHRLFTHTDFESIFASKLVRSPFAQSSSPFSPETTGVLDGGMMLFIYPRLLNWFSSSCCILASIPSSTGTSWVWSSFPKLSRSDSSILNVTRSCIAICTLEISGCAPYSIELTRLFILFRISLRIWTSFLEYVPSFFTLNLLISAPDACLLTWLHLWPIFLTVVASYWVGSWILSWTSLMPPRLWSVVLNPK